MELEPVKALSDPPPEVVVAVFTPTPRSKGDIAGYSDESDDNGSDKTITAMKATLAMMRERRILKLNSYIQPLKDYLKGLTSYLGKLCDSKSIN